MTTPPAGEGRSAQVSADRVYRYSLTRAWANTGAGLDLWLGLNPSTADAHVDDPSVRRMRAFSRRDGADGFALANPYAYRATQPRLLVAAMFEGVDVVGPDNDDVIAALAITARRVIAAWGVGLNAGRMRQVIELIAAARPDDPQLWCLGTTKAGHPRHPLYVRGDTPMVKWVAP